VDALLPKDRHARLDAVDTWDRFNELVTAVIYR
jgi:hypothetical protein